ncbi:MAG: cation transporter [Solirubrobacteraceae bacterium]
MSTVTEQPTRPATATVVLHVGRQYPASEKAVVEAALVRNPGVRSADANPVAQTATVRYDPSLTSVHELRRAVERCGFECAGCNVPGCMCDPLHEPGQPEQVHDEAAVNRAEHPTGHGEGGHSGHSMEHTATEMRNRFVLALAAAAVEPCRCCTRREAVSISPEAPRVRSFVRAAIG